mgnify:CR=1 FL=1
MNLRSALPHLTVVLLPGFLANPVLAGNKRVQLTDTGGLLVDCKPFLPFFVWAQPTGTLAKEAELGFNVVHAGETEDKDPIASFLDSAHKHGLLVLADQDRFSPNLKDHPALLAWTVEHEPETPENPPYQADLSKAPGTIWIEGEQPAESTFGHNPWLDKASTNLSGGKWLSGSASYE